MNTTAIDPLTSNPNRREFLAATGAGAAAVAALAILPELGFASALRLTDPMNLGVIGIGRQGRAILAELQKIENVHIAAICDSDPSRLKSGQRRAQEAEATDDYRPLLDRKDISAVIVATPTHLHNQIVADALAAGKHVYCEAPLAHTIKDAHAIAQSAKNANNLVFQTGMQGRSDPVYTLANSFKRSGAIRDVVTARAQYHRKTTWRSPASDPNHEKLLNWKLNPDVSLGLAGEMGTHQFDVLHWYLSRYPKSVRGTGSIRLHSDGRSIADTIQCSFDYGKGLHALYDATIANSYEGKYEQIVGTMGTIKLAWTHGWLFKEADAHTQGWEVYANRQQFFNEEGITLIADATKLAAQGKLKQGIGLPHPALYYALESFIKSIANQNPVACSADEGLRATVVGIKTNEAVLAGNEITIDESLFKTEG